MSNAEESPGPQTYEEARDELVAVVGKLETGGVSLQESVELWERGEELATVCQRWLDGVRSRLDQAMQESETPPAEEE